MMNSDNDLIRRGNSDSFALFLAAKILAVVLSRKEQKYTQLKAQIQELISDAINSIPAISSWQEMTDTSREAFEKWAKAEYPFIDLSKLDNGNFKEQIVFERALGWQDVTKKDNSYSKIAAVLPNGKTCSNVYEAYEIGLVEQAKQEPVGYKITGKYGSRCFFTANDVKKGDTVFISPPNQSALIVELVESLDGMIESYEYEASSDNPALLKAKEALAKVKGVK